MRDEIMQLKWDNGQLVVANQVLTDANEELENANES